MWGAGSGVKRGRARACAGPHKYAWRGGSTRRGAGVVAKPRTMPRPWKLLERVDTAEGPLELRMRDTRDFMISIAGRVLMSSLIHRSETLVAELGCERARTVRAPRVLIGGFGLGFTLRAALDSLPKAAHVIVAELNPVVLQWGRGPLAVLTDDALSDPRVEAHPGDVMDVVRRAAQGDERARFDAIIVDLYLGPSPGRAAAHDPLYGHAALRTLRSALRPHGSYAVWGETPDESFEQRLQRTGFRTRVVQNRGGGPRHVVYVATTGP
jgi:spermidine synthase